jgi:hypothetical protein
MSTATWAVPILPGQAEAWRRFVQELLGSRRADYAASRWRLGVHSEAAWLTRSPSGDLALLAVEADDPGAVLPRLAASDHQFDAWYGDRWLALHGFELARAPRLAPVERIYEWHAWRATRFSTFNLF